MPCRARLFVPDRVRRIAAPRHVDSRRPSLGTSVDRSRHADLVRTLVLLLGSALALSACSASDELQQVSADATPSARDDSGVPEEFRAACGKPGSKVVTERLEVRIKHSECDLTGVTIENQGRALPVPEPGFGSGDSTGVTIEVDKTTRDVLFTAEAEVAQY